MGRALRAWSQMLRYPASACLAVALAGSAPMRAEPMLAIADVAVVDALQGTRQPDQTVLIAGNRIVSIGPARSARVPADANVVQGSGKFLIPGLWDMHSHVVIFGPASLELYLAHGVTSVRDMGAERFADAKAWRDGIAAGQVLGPRMRIASPVVENADWLAAVKRMGLSTHNSEF
jgi:imidazolonepropionase-like amidohydrolase